LKLGPFDNPEATDLSELAHMRVVDEKAYTRRMQDLWNELKKRAGEDGTLDYWNFVKASDFAQTVTRAQLVSFLVSYGYANLRRKGNNLFLFTEGKHVPKLSGS